MSTGYGEGEGRVKKAIDDALNSPLLNDNDIFNSKKILLSIAFASEKKDNPGLTMDEMNDVNDFMEKFGDDFELKWGLAIDPELGSSDGNTTQYKRHPHIFLFKPEDLDNEDIILQVEGTPTYKRTRQMLEEIRNIASGNREEESPKDSEPIQGVISFA